MPGGIFESQLEEYLFSGGTTALLKRKINHCLVGSKGEFLHALPTESRDGQGYGLGTVKGMGQFHSCLNGLLVLSAFRFRPSPACLRAAFLGAAPGCLPVFGDLGELPVAGLLTSVNLLSPPQLSHRSLRFQSGSDPVLLWLLLSALRDFRDLGDEPVVSSSVVSLVSWF